MAETNQANEQVTQEPMDNTQVEEVVEQPTTTEDVKGSPTEDAPEVKTYTEEEVEKMIQSMTDKRVTEALKKAKGKWQTEYEDNLAKEKAEAERLAKLSAEERQKEELAKIQQAIDIERAEFERQREQFNRERLMLDTVKKLSADGMPTEFAEFLVGKNEDSTASNLNAFKELWNTSLQTAIEKHVEKRLKGTKPKATNDTTNEGRMMTKKEFANMPAKERMQMMKENPELVKQILAQK